MAKVKPLHTWCGHASHNGNPLSGHIIVTVSKCIDEPPKNLVYHPTSSNSWLLIHVYIILLNVIKYCNI